MPLRPEQYAANCLAWALTNQLFACFEADSNCLKVPEGLDDLDVLFLTDILPTAWHATEMGEVGPGDVVAIWGAGPGWWYDAATSMTPIPRRVASMPCQCPLHQLNKNTMVFWW
eukprot:GHRR01034784.1.p2 GENE.GHRR01034784.1~~GHRR01034784.1.p2  ORF type:complete len:114 (-),score=21.94 GHRR01034784.1:87-428(-)